MEFLQKRCDEIEELTQNLMLPNRETLLAELFRHMKEMKALQKQLIELKDQKATDAMDKAFELAKQKVGCQYAIKEKQTGNTIYIGISQQAPQGRKDSHQVRFDSHGY